MPSIARLPRLRRSFPVLWGGLAIVLLTGCAADTKGIHRLRLVHGSPTGLLARVGTGDCQSLAANTTGAVARRIYEEVADGPVIREAVNRTIRSPSLLAAVRSDDPLAAHRALKRLDEGQLIRAEVLRGSRTLAEIGGSPAIAPIREALRSSTGATIGTLVLSTQGTRAFIDTLRSLTGAHVLLSKVSPASQAGTSEVSEKSEASRGAAHQETYSFTGEGFPAGRLRMTLLIPPPPAWVCAENVEQTVTNTIGLIARRIYLGERSGAKVREIVRSMQSNASFVNAVANDSAAQARASIIGFFRSHLHVVRVRVTAGSKLLVDVGGPHVLAPVRGTLRLGGRIIGHFLVAIQDDTGYVKLVHLFTTAQVLLRPGSRQLIGTLAPNPALLHIPASGSFAFHGSTYQAYSFDGRSFPSGPLRISLLLPVG
jgi:hypothetical protein